MLIGRGKTQFLLGLLLIEQMVDDDQDAMSESH
jgi:hypothetical protein